MAAVIRLYLDENISPVVAEQLRRKGIEVFTLQDLDLLGDTDENHLARATAMGCVLCTQDDDYLRLAAQGIEHAGIVYSKMGRHEIGGWVKSLEIICMVYAADDMQNHIEYIAGVMMTVQTKTLSFQTRGEAHTLDITRETAQAVAESGLQAGIVTLFVPGSTAALTTIEFEDGAVRDFKRLFDEIAAKDRHYEHNARWHDGNGHSHVRAALLGPSLTVPFADGALLLGTWQQIIFVDFDNRARTRRVVVQIMGE